MHAPIASSSRSSSAGFTSLLLLVALLVQPCIAAAAALTSDTYTSSSQGFSLRGIYDQSTNKVNMTLRTSKVGNQLGWIGVGTGSKMAGSNMMIGWVNSDNSVTMSQRTTNRGHNDPTTNGVAANTYTADSGASKADSSGTTFAWTLDASAFSSSTPLKQVSMIWAVNSQGPSSSNPSANIRQHSNYGTIQLDLTKAYSAPSSSSGNSTSSSNTNSNNGLTAPVAGTGKEGSTSRNIIIAHLLVAILSWLLIATSGILIARFGRTLYTWFPAHRAIQLIAVVGAITAAVLGKVASDKFDGDSGSHGALGYLVTAGAILQAVLGFVGRKIFHSRQIRAVNYVHMALGIALVVVAVANMAKGFEIWGGAPTYAKVIVYVWAAVMAVAYIAGLVWGIPRERARDRQASEKAAMTGTNNAFGMQSRDNLLDAEKAGPAVGQPQYHGAAAATPGSGGAYRDYYPNEQQQYQQPYPQQEQQGYYGSSYAR